VLRFTLVIGYVLELCMCCLSGAISGIFSRIFNRTHHLYSSPAATVTTFKFYTSDLDKLPPSSLKLQPYVKLIIFIVTTAIFYYNYNVCLMFIFNSEPENTRIGSTEHIDYEPGTGGS